MDTIAEYSKAFAPIITKARTKGFQAEMIRQLANMGLIISRQELSQYLNANETVRREPGFGKGLLLLRAAKAAEKILGQGMTMRGSDALFSLYREREDQREFKKVHRWAARKLKESNPVWVKNPCRKLIEAITELEALTPAILVNLPESANGLETALLR